MKRKKQKYFIIIISLLLSFNVFAQPKKSLSDKYFPFLNVDTIWVDSVFNSLTPEQRIAQLFMVSAYSNLERKYNENVADVICQYNPGGIMFLKGGPVRQANMTNYLQSWSKVPLLIAVDGEWGLSMRLDSCVSYPRQMALGAMRDDSLIYLMAKEIAAECKRMGVHINFAPVVDVNNNPKNPVINTRSFGENKYDVARKGLLFMNGLQQNGIIATAKHFPGHGDTESDSHHTLPILNQERKRLDDVELFPFSYLIKNNALGVMVAHLNIPALDTTQNLPSSLSGKVVKHVLRDSMGFKGLVFSDALNMKGVTNYYLPGVAEVMALKAGIDVLLCSDDIETAIEGIKLAIYLGDLSQEEIDEKCKKILAAKYWAGLSNYKPIKTENLVNDLNKDEAVLLSRRLVENSITLLENKKNIIPLKNIDTLCIASLSVDEYETTPFQEMLGNYADFSHYNIMSTADSSKFDSMITELYKYNLIIIGIHSLTGLPSRNYGLSQNVMELIDTLSKNSKIIIDIFGNPYMLSIKGMENADAIIVSYQDKKLPQEISAQIIFGGTGVKGRLPVTASEKYPINSGLRIDKTIRLKYTIPEEIGISSGYLKKIDSIAIDGIIKRAYPGCQIIIVKKGNVIYKKSFGYHTYEKKVPVKNTDIYDLASLTKVLSTTLAVMKLEEECKINIENKISDYLPVLNNSNKKKIIIKDILTHQAGLQSWIPFYKKTIVKGKLSYDIYRTYENDTFPLQVADKIFIRKDYPDTIMKEIAESSLKKKKEYEYSDIGFYLMKSAIENITGEKIDNYVENNFYKPLGLSTMTYNPLRKFKISRIPPTEFDNEFRKQIIQGYVHDPGAAMLGGVGGHAGLFANANDVAKLMQMLLQKGFYADRKYINAGIIGNYTKCQFCDEGNRRGLGFDRPVKGGKLSPACRDASPESYGHTGFTGTYVWVDPKYDLIYVFLSNRVYPDAQNKKLANMNIRTDIQQVIYDAIKK
ncbi:MAG: glycoside hydrolase family 3 N-terminal domain-containing protein [Bacteroidales bacterium]|nr:glycoside hydrolase family 3 N-terminal domain-containing protein [Bacteroidales bacterium]